jgi:hypothetical protein
MTKYHPPINQRDFDELISLSQSKGEYQEDAIIQANEELKKRGLTEELILEEYAKLLKRIGREQNLVEFNESDTALTNAEKLETIIFCLRIAKDNVYEFSHSKGRRGKQLRRYVLIGFMIYFSLIAFFILYLYIKVIK